uniref:Uncharacterized protein n=1 Tax=Mantoniella antarctica TaxID=81844 RepID=A0A7S0SQ43_9CHLO|mmetsp:Transcript_31926/g.80308  ORF Transcript_31926/g.80308 Transcript_31926/m.80308 type:complete len:128 (+) Transcript_31926:336-719(+)
MPLPLFDPTVYLDSTPKLVALTVALTLGLFLPPKIMNTVCIGYFLYSVSAMFHNLTVAYLELPDMSLRTEAGLGGQSLLFWLVLLFSVSAYPLCTAPVQPSTSPSTSIAVALKKDEADDKSESKKSM